MQITYLGHACFKLKSKFGTVIMDPFHSEIGMTMSKENVDIATISHSHFAHDNLEKINGTTAHAQPLVVEKAGAYESGGISVFGIRSWQNDDELSDRGENIIFTVFMEDLNICHLGDLGTALTPAMAAEIGEVDVLFLPIGGSLGLKTYEKMMEAVQILNPSYFIPMMYKTDAHQEANFGDLKTLEQFVNEYGMSPTPLAKLEVEKSRLPEEMEMVVLEPMAR